MLADKTLIRMSEHYHFLCIQIGWIRLDAFGLSVVDCRPTNRTACANLRKCRWRYLVRMRFPVACIQSPDGFRWLMDRSCDANGRS